MSFLDLLMLILSSFLLIASLMIMFTVISDLFRDKELSGWWKAVWVFFLIFIPILTSLIYLIARGKGMTERQIALVKANKDATDSYIREVARTPADEIAAAKKLLDEGVITDAEFASLKAKALA